MLQDGRRGEGMPLGAVVRPVVMLVAGVAASAVLWRVLMLDPGGRGGEHGVSAEHVSPADGAALGRILKAP